MRSVEVDQSTGVHKFNKSRPVTLSISVSELRNLCSKKAACPRLALSFFADNGGDGQAVTLEANASAYLYLPALLMHHSGELLTLPLSLNPFYSGDNEQEGEGSGYSVVLEVLSPDSSSSSSSSSAPSSSQSSMEIVVSPHTLALKVLTSNETNTDIDADSDFNSTGGSDRYSVTVQTSLSLSGQSAQSAPQPVKIGKSGRHTCVIDGGSNGNGNGNGNGNRTFPLKLRSAYPMLDILKVQFWKSGSGSGDRLDLTSTTTAVMNDIGFIMIPLQCLLPYPPQSQQSQQLPQQLLGCCLSNLSLWRRGLTESEVKSTCLINIDYDYKQSANHNPDPNSNSNLNNNCGARLSPSLSSAHIDSDIEEIDDALPPAALGGWMNGQTNNNTNNTNTNTANTNTTSNTNIAFSREKTQPKRRDMSSNGQIMVCVQNMFFSSQPASKLSLKESDSVYVEVTVLPEGLKKRTQVSKLLLPAALAGLHGSYRR
jgi:hypothetical protein